VSAIGRCREGRFFAPPGKHPNSTRISSISVDPGRLSAPDGLHLGDPLVRLGQWYARDSRAGRPAESRTGPAWPKASSFQPFFDVSHSRKKPRSWPSVRGESSSPRSSCPRRYAGTNGEDLPVHAVTPECPIGPRQKFVHSHPPFTSRDDVGMSNESEPSRILPASDQGEPKPGGTVPVAAWLLIEPFDSLLAAQPDGVRAKPAVEHSGRVLPRQSTIGSRQSCPRPSPASCLPGTTCPNAEIRNRSWYLHHWPAPPPVACTAEQESGVAKHAAQAARLKLRMSFLCGAVDCPVFPAKGQPLARTDRDRPRCDSEHSCPRNARPCCGYSRDVCRSLRHAH